MASKTVTETTITETAAVAATFTKEQILAAKKYADRRDLLSVLLADNKQYTLAEADRLINEFMKKGVK